MAEHIWSVLCNDAVIDQRTKKTSLHGVVERLTVADFEKKLRNYGKKDNFSVATDFWLVSWWERSHPDKGETVDTRILIRSPGGERIFHPDQILPVDLTESPRGRVFTHIPGVPLRGPGPYKIVVEQRMPSGRWRRVARIPLDLRFADSQEEMQQQLMGLSS